MRLTAFKTNAVPVKQQEMQSKSWTRKDKKTCIYVNTVPIKTLYKPYEFYVFSFILMTTAIAVSHGRRDVIRWSREIINSLTLKSENVLETQKLFKSTLFFVWPIQVLQVNFSHCHCAVIILPTRVKESSIIATYLISSIFNHQFIDNWLIWIM